MPTHEKEIESLNNLLIKRNKELTSAANENLILRMQIIDKDVIIDELNKQISLLNALNNPL